MVSEWKPDARRSDKTESINRFNAGTKREFVGMRVDVVGEPRAWEAVVLPLNYARNNASSDIRLLQAFRQKPERPFPFIIAAPQPQA